jgi:hypothetical protein
MKKLSLLVLVILSVSCRKDVGSLKDSVQSQTLSDAASPSASGTRTYSSVEDFLKKNERALQEYHFSAEDGAQLVSPQGTTITIPPNAFLTTNQQLVKGQVTIQFKDLFKKADMVLSDKGTTTNNGTLLLSGGEFFINALQGTAGLVLNDTCLRIELPAEQTDTSSIAMFAQLPFVIPNDKVNSWELALQNTLTPIFDAKTLVYDLYHLGFPAGNGTWCNSDNPYFFNSYPQTRITVIPDGINDVTDVFLLFKGVSAMVHVYYDYASGDFPYLYAPKGLQCTAVCFEIREGQVFAAFSPVTIDGAQTIKPKLEKIRDVDFLAKLKEVQ